MPRSQSQRMVDLAGTVIVIIFGLFAVVFGVLDQLNLLGSIPIFEGLHASNYVLPILGVVLLYLILHGIKLDKAEAQSVGQLKEIQEQISVLQGNVRSLRSIEEVYSYAAHRIGQAKRTVQDVTWGQSRSTPPPGPANNAVRAYWRTKEYICAQQFPHRIEYQEVMTFPDQERVELVRPLMAPEFIGYVLKYYELDHTHAPPLLNFLIIDEEEVILAWYRSVDFGGIGDEVHLAVRNPDLVHLFIDYFTAIWQNPGAKWVKHGGADPFSAAPGDIALLEAVASRLERAPRSGPLK